MKGCARLLPFLTVMLLSSCGSRVSQFDQQLKDAEIARRAGAHSEEQRHFNEALRLAQSENEKGEALYRKAHAFWHSGQVGSGLRVMNVLVEEHPNSDRAPRAWLDLGRKYEQLTDEEMAESCYLSLLRLYPDSGGANTAATQIAALRHRRGTPPSLTYARLIADNHDPTLDAALRYKSATLLEEQDPSAAIQAYKVLADRHPLPQGSYTDEALLRAAVLLRKVNEPAKALLLLDELTSHDKRASLIGSYTRTAYLDAYLLRGQILRDDLKRFADARSAFEQLSTRHSGSRSLDNALFELSLVELREGRDVCASLDRLRASAPDSRYLRCSPFLCPVLRSKSQEMPAPCVSWLKSGTEMTTRPH